MGACSFTHTVISESPGFGFDSLVEEANYSHGVESYNGSINTCSMGRCTKKFDKANDTNRKKAYQHIREDENGQKWRADYIDVGVVRYDVITVKKKNVDYKAEFKLMYAVVKKHSNDIASSKNAFKTKTEADKKAVELTLKTGKEHAVVKEYVNIARAGGTVCTDVYTETKSYKTRPNLKPLPNRKIVEIHEYIFYGWASC